MAIMRSQITNKEKKFSPVPRFKPWSLGTETQFANNGLCGPLFSYLNSKGKLLFETCAVLARI